MKTAQEVYLQSIASYEKQIKQLKSKISQIVRGRLLLIFSIILVEYLQYKNWIQIPFHLYSILGVVGFLVLIRLHHQKKFQLTILETYLEINQQELNLIENGDFSKFPSGKQHVDPSHPYTFDLDIFGEHSLFQLLNRANTYHGNLLLADWLKHEATIETLKKRQLASKELSENPEVMQEIRVFTKLGADTEQTSVHLENWSALEGKVPLLSRILSFLLPALGLATTFLFWYTDNPIYFKWASLIFIFNVVHFGRFRKAIGDELGEADRFSETIRGYSRVLAVIENQNWKSERLTELQQRIKNEQIQASKSLGKLASIIQSLESVENGFAMAVFNGTLQFHLHVYVRLLSWKKQHVQQIKTWMEIIAEYEALLSLGNFHFNFTESHYPELSNEYRFEFEELGHPLLNQKTRVNNSVEFTSIPFTILTGSNMSGKSTFLRTVGIAIVMANAGAPVCARSARFTPISLTASMRLTDSLSESTSYFYAEVKRLEFIINSLKERPLFVLLDEILRGTNSDDKKTGTIGVIENMIAYPVFGIIATHDLEVCDTALKHPDKLINRCFEVDFVKDELYFDYKLREGVCQNKSATFIMKKHGVI